MSRREDIDNAIWSDPDFEALSLEATALYLWSFTNPRCGMAGIYKVSRRAMTESKVTDDRLDDAVTELAESRFMFYETGVLFVRARVKHMRQKTEQIAKSIRTDLTKIGPGHSLREAWCRENAGAAWLVRHLGIGWEARLDDDPQATVKPPSGEGQGVGSTKSFARSSTEGRSTLKGKGNGKGSGKGPGGVKENTPRDERARAWAEEHLPDLQADFVTVVALAELGAGRDLDPEQIRRQVLHRYPSLREAA